MNAIDSIMDFIAERQVDLQVMWGQMQYITPVVAYETFAKVWAATFEYYGIPPSVTYVGLPVIIFIGFIIGGQALRRIRYQHRFAKASADINEEWKEMVDDIRIIKRKLE